MNIQHVQETKQYFNLDTDPKELCEKGMIGETVLRPSLSKHKMFVQSTGLGARHLAGGSALLYVVCTVVYNRVDALLWTLFQKLYRNKDHTHYGMLTRHNLRSCR